MLDNNKTVFISYSWDSAAHQQWVMNLANTLRENGVDAKIDLFETQTGTIHLNQMMSSNMRVNDYIIIVMTEKYAEKANHTQGGVGFETLLSLPDLQRNPDKLIPIVRHNGNFDEAVPFHLKGYYAIDFSNESEFESKLTELLHRIEKVPMYEKAPLGEKAILKPRKDIASPIEKEKNLFDNIKIPTSRKYSDLDKDRFLVKSYDEMLDFFIALFDQIKKELSSFEYTKEDFGARKHVSKLYIDGQLRTGLKMWLGGHLMNGIVLSYGGHIDPHSDNSYNEVIMYEIKDDKELKLKMTLNLTGSNQFDNPKNIVQEIWERHLYHSIE